MFPVDINTGISDIKSRTKLEIMKVTPSFKPSAIFLIIFLPLKYQRLARLVNKIVTTIVMSQYVVWAFCWVWSISLATNVRITPITNVIM